MEHADCKAIKPNQLLVFVFPESQDLQFSTEFYTTLTEHRFIVNTARFIDSDVPGCDAAYSCYRPEDGTIYSSETL
jgi:hypothetical protein